MRDKAKAKTKPKPVKYELFENGLDFILSGLEHLSTKPLNKRAYKFGVLHLAAGIELILKERLRREHWSLLFENVDKANAAALASGVVFRPRCKGKKRVCRTKWPKMNDI